MHSRRHRRATRFRSFAAWGLFVFLSHSAAASQVIVTVTGTVVYGTDGNPDSTPPGQGNVFGAGNDLAQQPFALTFTFDTSLGTSSYVSCPGGAISQSSNTGNAPGPTAVLKIGNGSFTYGALPVGPFGWLIRRSTSTPCGPGNTIGFSWSENYSGAYGGGAGLGAVNIYPPTPLLSGDWRSSLPPTAVSPTQFQFNITVSQNVMDLKYAYGVLSATNISVVGAEEADLFNKDLGGQCSCSCPCNGDPITIGTGNVFEQVTDYETAGANKLSFARYYSSLAPPNAFTKTLGNNWRSTYDRFIGIDSATSVFAERANGQVLNFTLNNGVWTSDTDVDVQLTQSGSTWTLKDTDDSVETYTGSSGSPAFLSAIEARNGYTQTLQYNGSDQLASVTDSYGRALQFSYQNGLLASVKTPDGLVLTYGYAGTGGQSKLTSVTYSTTPQTSQAYLYENSALPYALTGITDENGNRFATWTYDASGRGLTSQHAGGADLTTVAYDDSTGNRTVMNALGQQETYEFTTLQGVPKLTELHRVASSSVPAAMRTFAYDTNGYLASQTDWNGNKTTYVNDIHGQPTTINEAVGTTQARTTTITYLDNYHLPSQIVTPGLTENFTYDGSGELLTRTLTDTTANTAPYSTTGQTRTWTYTWANFLLASVKAPRTDVSALTRYSYDGSGALTGITNALNQSTQITQHLPGGLPQAIVDPNGVKTTLTYDARLRLLSETVSTSAGPLVTKYAYDAAGNLLTVTLPDNSALTDTYDDAHRLTGVTDLFSNAITYTLDAAGDRTSATVANPGGNTTLQHSATFDTLGRLLHDVGGAGQTTIYGYDGNGNALTVTDPLQHATQRNFDALNRVAKITDAASGNTRIAYDAHDRPLTVTDPNGNTTSYTYDGFGDAIEEISPARGTTVYRYDLDGNLSQKIDARGAIASYSYDALDRITAVTYPGDSAENVAYTYDQSSGGFGIGRLTSVADAAGSLSRTYDERGNMLTESRANGSATLSTTYSYDAASRVASTGYPSGWVVGYMRDAMGRITAMTTKAPRASAATPLLSKIGYEPFGPVSGFTYGNGIVESRSFDLDYRLTNLNAIGNAPVQKLGYGYDAANNVLSITDGVTSGNSQKFGYDALNRLTGASGSYGSLGYSYDANGNRLTENPASSMVPATDGLGSVSAAIYNQAGRLATVNAGTQQLTQYTYDAFGHRSMKVGTLTPLTIYQYDQSGDLLEETSTTTGTQTDYIYLDGRPVAEISGGKVYFLHDDRLGTPQVATNLSQSAVWVGDYLPFGELSSSSQTALLGQDLRLPGQENDAETGLYHNGFRDYVPTWGRYLQSDLIGLIGGLNTYAYVGNGPVSRTDPVGFADFCKEVNAPEAIPGCSLSSPLVEGGGSGGGYHGAPDWPEPVPGPAQTPEPAGETPTPGQQCPPHSPNFIVTPGGTTYPVPEGAIGPVDTDSPDSGFQFQGGSGGNGLSPNTSSFRFMAPTNQGPYAYPNGYGSYSNPLGQTVNPLTGRTISRSDPWWHIPSN